MKINSAEILCVGTELLLGDIVNTNAAYISQQLASLGIGVYHHSVVGDNDSRLKDALELAFSRADLVVMTGGLGPTYDDMTKETTAAYFNRKLVLHEESLERMKIFFKDINKEMTDNNKKQAYMPEDAIVFKNDNGTAPGLAIEDSVKGKIAVMLPGPPSEMIPMFENEVLPYLKSMTEDIIFSRNIRIFGMGESAVENILSDMMKNAINPSLAPYCGDGEVRLRVTAKGKSESECADMCNGLIDKIMETEVGQYVYGIDVKSLEEAVVKSLIEASKTVAVAESCTGGYIQKRITDIAGSSEIFLGGVVSYANEVKMNVLGVNKKTLEHHGAVSPETAAEMAAGVRKICGADIGISTTGIAGPGGGTIEKPVGLVYVGINSDNLTEVIKLNIPSRIPNRAKVRHTAASNALSLILRSLNVKK